MFKDDYPKIWNVFSDLIKADRKLFPKLKQPEDIQPKLDKVKDKHLFLDSMIGNVGNHFAYQNLLQKYHNSGIHIAINANSFSDINSQFGYKVGDNAIKKMFDTISITAGKYSLPVFRTRGDEAHVLAPNEEVANQFVKDLSQALEQMDKINNQHKLTVSIGLGYNHPGAEKALDYAKHALSHMTVDGQVERIAKPGAEHNIVHSLLSQGAPTNWQPLDKIDTSYTFDDTLASPGLSVANPL